jgi:hypothetical protein
MRWRWPPENSCGKRCSAAAQADPLSQVFDACAALRRIELRVQRFKSLEQVASLQQRLAGDEGLAARQLHEALPVVVLPQPDSPTSAKVRRRATSKPMSCNTAGGRCAAAGRAGRQSAAPAAAAAWVPGPLWRGASAPWRPAPCQPVRRAGAAGSAHGAAHRLRLAQALRRCTMASLEGSARQSGSPGSGSAAAAPCRRSMPATDRAAPHRATPAAALRA